MLRVYCSIDFPTFTFNIWSQRWEQPEEIKTAWFKSSQFPADAIKRRKQRTEFISQERSWLYFRNGFMKSYLKSKWYKSHGCDTGFPLWLRARLRGQPHDSLITLLRFPTRERQDTERVASTSSQGISVDLNGAFVSWTLELLPTWVDLW